MSSGRSRAVTVWRTVALLGLTSLLTDLSAEMVTSVLPIYLVVSLGFTPLGYGLLNGVYQGASIVVRLAGGIVADRWRRHKEVAATGYALSAVTKIGLLVAGGSAIGITASLAADRVGKGIRTAPRDAMLSLAARGKDLGLVFGVHRAMDTAGAMLGPLAAFALLALAPSAYDLVFVVSLCVAVVGVAVLLFLGNGPEMSAGATPAPTPAPSSAPTTAPTPTRAATSALTPARTPALAPAPTSAQRAPARRGCAMGAAEQRPNLRGALRLLHRPDYRALVIVAALLAAVTVGDGFVYLRLAQRSDLAVEWFPLLAASTALVYLVLAVPVGRLADRVGRLRVLLAGYAALLGTYLLLWSTVGGTFALLASLALLGTFYAATDGVLAAAASAMLPRASRTSGLALLQTVSACGLLLSSVIFGFLWTEWGVRSALLIVIATLGCALMSAAMLFRRRNLSARLRRRSGDFAEQFHRRCVACRREG